MQFLRTLYQAKARAKLVVQCFGVIAHNLKSAAFCGTFWSERADDYVTTKLHSAGDLSHVRSAVLGCGKKMKDCTVVPQVISSGLELCFRDIGDEPMDLFCAQTQPFPRNVDSGLRNIEYRDVLIAARKEVINKGRFAAANVNEGCGSVTGHSFDQSKRSLQVRTVPTHLVRCLGVVDLVPVVFYTQHGEVFYSFVAGPKTRRAQLSSTQIIFEALVEKSMDRRI